MPRLQRADIVEAIRKHYEIKGEPAIDTVSPEIVPVSIVDVLDRPEVGKMAIGEESLTGTTNGALIGLRTVPGSGLLCEVTHVVMSSTGNVTLEIYEGDHSLAGAVTYGYYRDSRIAGRPGTQIRNQDAAAVPATSNRTGMIQLGANTPITIVGPWFIEGEALTFAVRAAGASLLGTFFWREYPEDVP